MSDLLSRWITALESGKYEQNHGTMRRADSYCCLGVLCDVVDPGAWSKCIGLSRIWGDDGDWLTVPKSTWAKLPARLRQSDLITLNDEKRASFKEIAAYLRGFDAPRLE